jgi:hypothetical protein
MRSVTVLFALTLLLVWTSGGLAQLEPGDAWVAFDPLGTMLTGYPPAFTTDNTFYVFAYGIELSGYEFSISISDPSIVVLGASELTNPEGSINVGTAPLEWIVGVGFCTGDDFTPLVEVTYGYFVPLITDVLVCLGPSEPASLTPPVPAYLDCAGSILPFTAVPAPCVVYPDGCGVLWPTECPVATETASWSALKIAY